MLCTVALRLSTGASSFGGLLVPLTEKRDAMALSCLRVDAGRAAIGLTLIGTAGSELCRESDGVLSFGIIATGLGGADRQCGFGGAGDGIDGRNERATRPNSDEQGAFDLSSTPMIRMTVFWLSLRIFEAGSRSRPW
jgi:hypothetical protein